MNVLIIGSGGREHAVAKEFNKSKLLTKLYCSPGNAGISEIADCVKLNLHSSSEVVEFCKTKNISFVFIGPEDPLVFGLSDALRAAGIKVFGPSKSAAQLEGSKIFAKTFMQQAQVPTAKSFTVTTVSECMSAAQNFSAPYILKADGLAAGKGVFICKTLKELEDSAVLIFENKILGDAGSKALLEANLPGYELSYFVLTNGEKFVTLPIAQDHKRLKDQNEGPNTGGMGTVAPLKIDRELENKIIERIVKPSVDQLKKNQLQYLGVLFIGLMIVENEPYVLEYNVRFGDPETQVLLPLIDDDVLEIFFQIADSALSSIKFSSKAACCIVNAAPGYPEKPVKNILIQLPKGNETSYILHAGTVKSEEKILSAGGRVLNVVAVADSISEAISSAYALNDKIEFPQRQFRTDIGKYYPKDR